MQKSTGSCYFTQTTAYQRVLYAVADINCATKAHKVHTVKLILYKPCHVKLLISPKLKLYCRQLNKVPYSFVTWQYCLCQRGAFSKHQSSILHLTIHSSFTTRAGSLNYVHSNRNLQCIIKQFYYSMWQPSNWVKHQGNCDDYCSNSAAIFPTRQ